MSLTLTTNPVVTEGGIKKNIFPGRRPVEYSFKREDLSITSVGESSGFAQVTIATDLTSYLSVGDYIYLYAPGDSGDYTYDKVGEITNIAATTIDTDIPYIETATSGYINYLKNYYIEMQLVNPSNSSIQLIDFSLKNDGDPAGNITIDVSIGNDENDKLYSLSNRELTEGRIRFDVRYREVSLGSIGSWTSLSDPVIIVEAWEQMEIEQVINSFDLPKVYKGYDSAFLLSHSDQNGTDTFVAAYYDELDINQNNINTDNILGQLSINLYGMLQFILPSTTSFQGNTKYIKVHGDYTNLPDYNPLEYESPDYKIT